MHRECLQRNQAGWPCPNVNHFSWQDFFTALINILRASTTVSFSIKPDSGPIKCQEKTSTSDGDDSTHHIESFWHPTKRRCCGNCKRAFAVASISTQVSKTSCLALPSFKTTSIIQLKGFCSYRCITFLSERSSARKTICSSGGTCGIIFIAFIHHKWIVDIFPCPP